MDLSQPPPETDLQNSGAQDHEASQKNPMEHRGCTEEEESSKTFFSASEASWASSLPKAIEWFTIYLGSLYPA